MMQRAHVGRGGDGLGVGLLDEEGGGGAGRKVDWIIVFLFQTYVIQRIQFRHMGGTQGTRAAGRDAFGVSTVDSWTGCSGDPSPERFKRTNVF